MKHVLILPFLVLATCIFTPKAQAQSFERLSLTARGLSQLNWNWNDGANMSDKGTGRPLRNWDRQSKMENRLDDIFLSWDKQPVVFEEYLVFIGWQGWPNAIIEKDHPEGYFLPEYVENLANNKFNSVKYVTVKASAVPVNCLKFPASRTDNEFYYVKVVGKTADNTFHDVKGCILASEYRRKKEGLSAVPKGTIPTVKVPAGGRERNELENQLALQAKKNRKK
jgi:hypothetical protein